MTSIRIQSMTFVLKSFIFLIAATMVFTANSFAQTNPLSSYRWDYRLLLVFAENSSNPQFRSMEQTWNSEICELEDRDLLIGHIFSQEPSRMGSADISQSAASQIRRSFNVDDKSFVVILVGRDGGEKARYREVPDPSLVFSKIDRMPMRLEEMAGSPSPC